MITLQQSDYAEFTDPRDARAFIRKGFTVEKLAPGEFVAAHPMMGECATPAEQAISTVKAPAFAHEFAGQMRDAWAEAYRQYRSANPEY